MYISRIFTLAESKYVGIASTSLAIRYGSFLRYLERTRRRANELLNLREWITESVMISESGVGISEDGVIDINIHVHESLLEQFLAEKKLSLTINLQLGTQHHLVSCGTQSDDIKMVEDEAAKNIVNKEPNVFEQDALFDASTEAYCDQQVAGVYDEQIDVPYHPRPDEVEYLGWGTLEPTACKTDSINEPPEDEHSFNARVIEYAREVSSGRYIRFVGPCMKNGVDQNMQWGWAGYGMGDEEIAEIERKTAESRARVKAKIINGEL
uniref:AP2/ERF domain-containing protein n=1 Tax=Steinernema glaseri TaxID=37863 RepID=A0A1I8AGX3_9BILA